jgi:hypothetical protein
MESISSPTRSSPPRGPALHGAIIELPGPMNERCFHQRVQCVAVDRGLDGIRAASESMARRRPSSSGFVNRKVATLDRRHFSVIRPRHVDALELLPS